MLIGMLSVYAVVHNIDCIFMLISQGARGFPGTPGLPGIKGHRVSMTANNIYIYIFYCLNDWIIMLIYTLSIFVILICT